MNPSRWAEADAARAEAKWGMGYVEDDRPSPERLAWEAAQRGDTWFQIDLPVAVYQGNVASGMPWSRAWRPPPVDHIGAIERQGWGLQHVSTCFVSRGASANGASDEAINGDVVALYVFRRGQQRQYGPTADYGDG